MTACGSGESESDTTASEADTTAAAETTEEAAEADTAAADETTAEEAAEADTTAAEETTTEEAESNEVYEYYELRQKTHSTMPEDYGWVDDYKYKYPNFKMIDGKIYYGILYDDRYVNDKDYYEMYSYDISSKETKKAFTVEDICISNICTMQYADGFFWDIVKSTSLGCYTLEKRTIDGSLVASYPSAEQNDGIVDVSNLPSQFLDDGSFYYCIGYDGFAVFSSDFKEITMLPSEYEYEVEHGITEKQFFDYNEVCYLAEGKFYIIDDYYNYTGGIENLYYLDETNNVWKQCTENDLPKEEYIVKNDSYYYDLSTGKQTNYVNFGGYEAYTCEDYSIVLYRNQWYKVRIPKDGSELDFSKYEPMSSESGEFTYNICPLDGTYYVYKDNYGLFLRTYEKGEEEEETIVLFDN